MIRPHISDAEAVGLGANRYISEVKFPSALTMMFCKAGDSLSAEI